MKTNELEALLSLTTLPAASKAELVRNHIQAHAETNPGTGLRLTAKAVAAYANLPVQAEMELVSIPAGSPFIAETPAADEALAVAVGAP